jgi:hypothetical protein
LRASVAYLPGLALRGLADLPAKTHARDAARALPHTLRRVVAGDEAFAEMEVLICYDDDLAAGDPFARVTYILRLACSA